MSNRNASKGLLCGVYRSPLGDSTSGGVSSRASSVVLIGAEGPFEPSDTLPALYLGKWKGQLIALPTKPMLYASGDVFSPEQFMFGGNFLYTSDSRFPSAQPIKIFDRLEWRP